MSLCVRRNAMSCEEVTPLEVWLHPGVVEISSLERNKTLKTAIGMKVSSFHFPAKLQATAVGSGSLG